ncbi:MULTISPECIES: hypothetical protein [Vibrio]|uniref:hypothetical protein n=1 Tax=Vibrio TaxID=662 RepID=UPI00142EF25C|nr:MULTISPECIES: hypothetical protein [Vibrio]
MKKYSLLALLVMSLASAFPVTQSISEHGAESLSELQLSGKGYFWSRGGKPA